MKNVSGQKNVQLQLQTTCSVETPLNEALIYRDVFLNMFRGVERAAGGFTFCILISVHFLFRTTIICKCWKLKDGLVASLSHIYRIKTHMAQLKSAFYSRATAFSAHHARAERTTSVSFRGWNADRWGQQGSQQASVREQRTAGLILSDNQNRSAGVTVTEAGNDHGNSLFMCPLPFNINLFDCCYCCRMHTQ